MNKITIEFDKDSIPYYINGPKFYSVLLDLSQALRSRMKYEDESETNNYKTVEAIREELNRLWCENMYDIDLY